jgi:hypothetical protein
MGLSGSRRSFGWDEWPSEQVGHPPASQQEAAERQL